MPQSLSTLPQPQGPNVVAEYYQDNLNFLSRCARDYEEIVPIQMDDGLHCLLTNPDHIAAVLKDRKLFTKASDLQLLKDLLGNGLVVSEGSFWSRQRRLIQPVFHRERIHSYGATMVEYAQKMLQSWQSDEQHNVSEDMARLTLNIVMKTLFDQDLTGKDAANVALVLDATTDWIAEQALATAENTSVPEAANTRYKDAIALFVKTLDGMIKQRHQAGLTGNDLLTLLMQVEDADDGSRMSNQQLRDESVTLIIAGHETTANTLTWAWYLLGQHPKVQSKLQEELRTVLAGRVPTVEDLPNLIYANQIIQEAMRLYPAAIEVTREASEDCEIGGYCIPRGTTLIASQWVMHRDPQYFENPELFQPERWADELEKRLPRGVYFPFGDGPRVCIGKSFAQMEAVLILATIAQQFTLELVPNQEIVLEPSLTLRPKDGLQVILRHVC